MGAGPRVVSVHALESRAGDGLVADAAVVSELACSPISIATAVAIASASGLDALEPLPAALLARQLASATAGEPPAAAKVAVVTDAAQVDLVAGFLRSRVPECGVYAPVVRIAGSTILDDGTLAAARSLLFPAARVVVARAVDLVRLTGREASDIDGLRGAARYLRERGARAALIAGLLVHGRVLDLLDDGGRVVLLDAARLQAPRIHGLAGAHAAALAAHLARGAPLATAAEAAQRYVGFRLLRGR